MSDRHTKDHDQWDPEGFCDVVVADSQGVARSCGHYRGYATRGSRGTRDVRRVEEAQLELTVAAPRRRAAVRWIAILLFAVVGALIGLEWWRFLDEASRNENDTMVLFPFLERFVITAIYVGAVWKVFGR